MELASKLNIGLGISFDVELSYWEILRNLCDYSDIDVDEVDDWDWDSCCMIIEDWIHNAKKEGEEIIHLSFD